MRKVTERYCELCGAPIEKSAPRSKRCKACREYKSKASGANLAKYSVAYDEGKRRRKWEDKVYPKLDRIVGKGYAERQIAESLKLAGKINTKL